MGICEWQISLPLATIKQERYCFSKLAKHKKKKTQKELKVVLNKNIIWSDVLNRNKGSDTERSRRGT